MACYHFTMKPDKKPNGTQIKAIEHISYISREGKYKDIDQTHEFLNFKGNMLGAPSSTKVPHSEKYLLYKSPFGNIRSNDDKVETSVDASLETLSIALMVAQKKYGDEIQVEGTDDFKAKIIFTAVEIGLPIKFSDPDMERQKIRFQEECTNGNIVRKLRATYDGNKPDLERPGSSAPPQRRGRLHELSMCPMVQHAEGSNLLLPRDVPNKLDNQQTQLYTKVRWHLPANRQVIIKNSSDKIIEIEKARTQLLASAHVDYINRDKNFSERGGCIYKNHHLPKWAYNSPKNFFEAADQYEGIGYSRYKEIEFALPNELNLNQQKEIINRFLENHLKDFYYAYAVHDKIGVMSNGQHNTHVHIMFSERKMDEREKTAERAEKEFFARPSTVKGKQVAS